MTRKAAIGWCPLPTCRPRPHPPGCTRVQMLERTAPKTRALLSAGVDLSPWFVPAGYDATRR